MASAKSLNEDLSLLGRAVSQVWNVPERRREKLANRLMGIAETTTDMNIYMKAMNILLGMVRQNQVQENSNKPTTPTVIIQNNSQSNAPDRLTVLLQNATPEQANQLMLINADIEQRNRPVHSDTIATGEAGGTA